MVDRLASLGDTAISFRGAVRKQRPLRRGWLCRVVVVVVVIIIQSSVLGLIVSALARLNLIHLAGIDDGASERGRVDRHVFDAGIGPGARAAVFGYVVAMAGSRLAHTVDGGAFVSFSRCRLLGAGPVGDSALGKDVGDVSRFIGSFGVCCVHVSSMSLFGSAYGVRRGVIMASAAMAVSSVAVVMEQEQADDV